MPESGSRPATVIFGRYTESLFEGGTKVGAAGVTDEVGDRLDAEIALSQQPASGLQPMLSQPFEYRHGVKNLEISG